MGATKAILVGRTGLYCHRMSAKAKRLLMIGGRKKTAAERLEIKHDPRVEFMDSMYVQEGFHAHSHIMFPSMAIKSAMGTAALAVPGIRKTDVQRLVFLPHEFVPVFGIPKLRMDITRSSDMNRTPDVRTRAYFAEWAVEVDIQYATPALSKKAIGTLLTNAGLMCGIGDNRQEKGKGSFGTFNAVKLMDPAFTVTADDIDADLLDGAAQLAAIKEPQPANRETEELLREFDGEVESRDAT